MLCILLEEKDGLLGGRSEEVARLKTQTERGAGHLGDEQVALGEPIHIARKYFLRCYAPVGPPSVLAHQVACENFMPKGLENGENSLGCLNRGTTPGNGEAQIDFHTAKGYLMRQCLARA